MWDTLVSRPRSALLIGPKEDLGKARLEYNAACTSLRLSFKRYSALPEAMRKEEAVMDQFADECWSFGTGDEEKASQTVLGGYLRVVGQQLKLAEEILKEGDVLGSGGLLENFYDVFEPAQEKIEALKGLVNVYEKKSAEAAKEAAVALEKKKKKKGKAGKK